MRDRTAKKFEQAGIITKREAKQIYRENREDRKADKKTRSSSRKSR